MVKVVFEFLAVLEALVAGGSVRFLVGTSGTLLQIECPVAQASL